MTIILPCYGNVDLTKALLKRAKELGYIVINTVDDCKDRCIVLDDGQCREASHGTYNIYKMSNFQHISLEEFFFTDKYRIQQPIKVKLSSEYTAEVTDKTIKVGCTEFPIEKLEELKAALIKYNSKGA